MIYRIVGRAKETNKERRGSQGPATSTRTPSVLVKGGNGLEGSRAKREGLLNNKDTEPPANEIKREQ